MINVSSDRQTPIERKPRSIKGRTSAAIEAFVFRRGLMVTYKKNGKAGERVPCQW